MAIVTEFDASAGDKVDIKLIPIDNTGTGANVENVDFQSDDAAVVLTVDITNPLLFHADIGDFGGSDVDVTLHLEADGKLGEGVSQISKNLICHLRKREAVDVKFDVTVTSVEPVPVPEPTPIPTPEEDDE